MEFHSIHDSSPDAKFANKHLHLFHDLEKEVMISANDIDPSDELDWYSLIVGWAISKGLDPENAHTFARIVRYHTDMG